jgi:hypothetical protein
MPRTRMVQSIRLLTTETPKEAERPSRVWVFAVCGLIVLGNVFTVWQERDAQDAGRKAHTNTNQQKAPWELDNDDIALIRKSTSLDPK